MVDLTDPSPLVMTHFEFIGFISGVLGTLAVVAWDYFRQRNQGG